MKYEEYVADVIAGNVVVGSLMKKCVERFVLLQNQYTFKKNKT